MTAGALQDCGSGLGATRHMLHATEVEIEGPLGHVHAVAPVAPDFEACRAELAEIGAALLGDEDVDEDAGESGAQSS